MRSDLRYVLMPNHFHLILWPADGQDEALSPFMKWLTLTHAHRWHAHRHSAGTGALYGARFKSFPVRHDEHFLKVCRYVERNPLRAGLVTRAEHWPWCSLHKRLAARTANEAPQVQAKAGIVPNDDEVLDRAMSFLDDWPMPEPADWLEWVNQPGTVAELEALRRCVRRGRPFGDDAWTAATAARLGLGSSLHPLGRPAKRESAHIPS